MTIDLTAADRVAFTHAVHHGGVDLAAASRLGGCHMLVDDTVAGLLGLPDGATYAVAAARVIKRAADGRPPL